MVSILIGWRCPLWIFSPRPVDDISTRADSRFAPSQWETALLCNDVSHWLGAKLESALWLRSPMIWTKPPPYTSSWMPLNHSLLGTSYHACAPVICMFTRMWPFYMHANIFSLGIRSFWSVNVWRKLDSNGDCEKYPWVTRDSVNLR